MKQIKLLSIQCALLMAMSLTLTFCKSKSKTDDVPAASAPASMDTSTMAAPVQMATDTTLQQGVKDATKDFPGVTATINNGEVDLNGTITRDKLPALMQSISSLHPKKINNHLTINK